MSLPDWTPTNRLRQPRPLPAPRGPRQQRRLPSPLATRRLPPRLPPRLQTRLQPRLPRRIQESSPAVPTPAPRQVPTTRVRTSQARTTKKTQPSITPLGRGTKARLEITLRKNSKSRGHTTTSIRAPLSSGSPTSTELCPAARPEPVKGPRLYTCRGCHLGTPAQQEKRLLESHPKTDKAAREHLEENWTYTFGIHEYLLARLDFIEGLQGDSQAQAQAEIQQARVRPLRGRGSISAETYQIYLPADTRAKVSAATSRKPWHANNRGPDKSKKPKSNNSNTKSPGPSRK
jgi:hypothetical protein